MFSVAVTQFIISISRRKYITSIYYPESSLSILSVLLILDSTLFSLDYVRSYHKVFFPRLVEVGIKLEKRSDCIHMHRHMYFRLKVFHRLNIKFKHHSPICLIILGFHCCSCLWFWYFPFKNYAFSLWFAICLIVFLFPLSSTCSWSLLFSPPLTSQCEWLC